jgi:alpha-N-arabinofuranosidase
MVTINTTDALNGNASLQLSSRSPRALRVEQGGFNLKAGETYIFSCWTKLVRGTDIMTRVENIARNFQDNIPGGRDTATLGFGFNFGDGTGQSFPEALWATGEWTRFETEFTPLRDVENATFRMFVIPQNTTVLIDQISIMPKSWLENYDGMRPDLVQAIADLRPPTIRYPGGCFASAYRWKDGIGPQHERQPYPFTIWNDVDVNSFGTDEFMALCRRVGAEPIIVINTGTPMWNVNRTPETADVDWLQEALDWLEYCNGCHLTTKWGAVRAANGHPAPYNVRYWEIDNEIELSAEAYIETLKKFVPAMKAIDPTIKIIACGSWRGGQADAARFQFDSTMIMEAGHLFDYLSYHEYEWNANRFAVSTAVTEAYFLRLKEVIDNSPNPNIKIYDSEWNLQSTDWRTGLYAGGLLNVFERCGDFVTLAAPALFLRHYVSAGGVGGQWDNAFINFNNTSWFPAPNYVVMKLWRDHYAPIRIGLEGDEQGLSVVATKSEDGKTLYFKAVNALSETRNVTLNVGDGMTSATMKLIAESLNARNTFESPNAIAQRDVELQLDGGAVKFALPAYSVGIVVIE